MTAGHRKVGAAAVTAIAIGLAGPGSAVGAGASGYRAGTINATERARLHSLALTGARRFGESHPTNLQAVATTYANYHKHFGAPGGQPLHAGNIYVIEMGGHFKLPVPGGRTFRYDVILVNAKSNTILRGLLGNARKSLSVLGTVTSL
jgi:hypothetical protein